MKCDENSQIGMFERETTTPPSSEPRFVQNPTVEQVTYLVINKPKAFFFPNMLCV